MSSPFSFLGSRGELRALGTPTISLHFILIVEIISVSMWILSAFL